MGAGRGWPQSRSAGFPTAAQCAGRGSGSRCGGGRLGRATAAGFPRESPRSQRNRPRPDTAVPDPSPVPLECLYDTSLIIERTRGWRDGYDPEPNWDDPQVWAYRVDREMIWLNGPVRPIVGSPGTAVVGDTNGDVLWLLDFDLAPRGTPGQVVRVDVECASWDVLAPPWTQLLVRYAEDLELFAADPDSSALEINELGPACE